MTMKNVEDVYSLSPMQHLMLFHAISAPKSKVLLEQLSCTFCGDLDASALGRAWQRVLDRHPILRTAFLWQGLKEPLQIVCRRVELPWKQQDWRRLSPAAQEDRLQAFLQADQNRGYELFKAPLMRVTLIQLAEDTYHFIWSYHHLLLDGWSMSLVLKEVFAFYEAFHRGQDLYLERPRSFRDYIAWLKQQDLSKAEAFWRRTLKGFTAPTPLEVDRALGGAPDQYSERQIQLSAATTAILRSLVQQHQLTLNTIVQGVWGLLLSRYSGEDEVIFGITVSGRPAALAGVESIVGPFINNLPMRVKVSPEDSLLSWLKKLQAHQVELCQYEHSSLAQIQEWGEVPRGLRLFESLVIFQNYPVDASLHEMTGSLQIRGVRGGLRTNYPLAVVTGPGPNLLLRISYDCRRFAPSTITRMLGHLQALLESIVADPEQRLSDLTLLTEAERHQLLMAWNDTHIVYLKDKCIHQLFEAQVERMPEAVAAVFEGEQLSYGELNRRANQLAHHLRALGVGSKVHIGIYVERSLDMIVGLLGILKAGGVCVPLDLTTPEEDVAHILQDTGTFVLLTQKHLLARLPEHGALAVCLDTDWKDVAQEREANVSSGVGADNLAYVIYTTGEPMGVQIPHCAVVNLLNLVHRQMDLTAQDVFLAISPLSFGSAALELFLPLMLGARLMVASHGAAFDGPRLLGELDNSGATAMHAAPAIWRLLLKAGWWPGSERLKILCSGQVLLRGLANRLLESGDSLWNLYGTKETTMWSLVRRVDSRNGSVLIGHPIANTRVYLLDAHLRPVPAGVPGKVHIGGVGLARGYLDRPGLTAEKFVPDPFSDEPGARLYKTGDLARYLPDGNIEFLGSVDHQVRVYGFRIRPAEVEAVLGQHSGVGEVVAVARDAGHEPSEKRLVAYIVPSRESAPTTGELRSLLREKLPGYVAFSDLVLLETLPLAPNGKVDRLALLALDGANLDLRRDFVAPRDVLELQLTQIWEDLLDVRPIGVTDSFFELGGNSLLAVHLMAQVRERFGQAPLLSVLSEADTVEHMACILRERTDSSSWSPLVAIQPAGSKRPFFCVHPGPGIALCYIDLARHLGSGQPFYGLQARGLDGEQEPLTRIEDMAACYIEAMRFVQPEGPYLLGGHSFGGFVAFEMAQQLQRQGDQVALLALLDVASPVSVPAGIAMDDIELLVGLAEVIERFLGRELSVSYSDLRELGPDERLNYLLERLKKINFVPPDADLSVIRGLWRVVKANSQAFLSYVPQVYPGQITLFRVRQIAERAKDLGIAPQGLEEIAKRNIFEAIRRRWGQAAYILRSLQEQRHLSLRRVRKSMRAYKMIEVGARDRAWGWGDLSTEPVKVHFVPGHHVSMISEPHVRVLAEQLKVCINRDYDNKGG